MLDGRGSEPIQAVGRCGAWLGERISMLTGSRPCSRCMHTRLHVCVCVDVTSVRCCRSASLTITAAAGGRCPCRLPCMWRTSGEEEDHHQHLHPSHLPCTSVPVLPPHPLCRWCPFLLVRLKNGDVDCVVIYAPCAPLTIHHHRTHAHGAVVPHFVNTRCRHPHPAPLFSCPPCPGCCPTHPDRIEPDGQRPKVLIHGKACRKTAHPKCAYDTSDTRSGIEVRPCVQGLGYRVVLCARVWWDGGTSKGLAHDTHVGT